jgi:hypothetical protein
MATWHLHSGANLFGAEQRLSSQAPFTSAARRLDPGNTDSIADAASSNSGADADNLTRRLMSQGSRESPWNLSPSLMNIGETQAAGMNFNQDLIGTRFRGRNFFYLPLTINFGDNSGFHDSSLFLI